MKITNQLINFHEGEALKAYTVEKGLHLTVLAGQLGISRQTLYQWFEKPKLSEDVIFKILQKMEPPPPFLLGVSGEPTLANLFNEIRTVKALLIKLLEKEKSMQ